MMSALCRSSKLSLLTLALASSAMAVSTAGSSGKPAEVAKELDAAAYDANRTLVKPGEDEWRWRAIDWMQSVSAAQKKSVADGKPILLSGAAQGSVIGCL